MASWLRRLTAFSLVMLLATSQTLVPSITVAQPLGPLQGQMQVRTILEGEVAEGEVDRSDMNIEGFYFETFVFAGYADDRVTVAIGPTRMTGVLVVSDVNGDLLGELEFSPNSPVRALRVEIPADGIYSVVVGSETGGEFAVTLSSKGDSGDVDPMAGISNLNVVSLQLGQWHEGRLDENGSASSQSEDVVFDMYSVTGEPGQRYRVIVESDSFNPIILVSAIGDEEPTTEMGRNGRAELRGRFDDDGMLIVGVASLDGEMGDYRIIIQPDGRR